MKRLLSLILIIIIILSTNICIFSDEGQVAEENFIRRTVPQELIDVYISQLKDDPEKIEMFLNIISQKEADGIHLDDRRVYEIFKEVQYAGVEISSPIKVINSNNAEEAQMKILSREHLASMETNTFGLMQSSQIYIDNLNFYSGLNGDTQIKIMQSGDIRSKFDVVNELQDESSVMAIVKMQHINTKVLYDVAIIQKTIAANSNETITVGFIVPDDAVNYEIVVSLWDNSEDMNLISNEITFPEPRATITITNAATNASFFVAAKGYYTVEYNNKIEIHEDNGTAYSQILINETGGITTPIIIMGDLIELDFYSITYPKQITSFHAQGLSSLTRLNLRNNKITELPIAGLSSLTYLDLEYNELTKFSAVGLSSLTYLNLGNNELTEFSAVGLNSLITLGLNSNKSLSNLTIPNFKDIPSGNSGFKYLLLYNTSLAKVPTINSVWSNIINNLPRRNNSSTGVLYIANPSLKADLINALTTPTNKYWDIL